MTQRFFTNELITEIITLINNNLKTSLGLQIVSRGSLKYFNFDSENILSKLPAVLVIPDFDSVEMIGMPEVYGIVHNIRLLYIKKYDTTEEIVKLKIADLLKFAELIVDNIFLTSPTLTNGQIQSALVREVDYDPEEENVLKALNANITVGSVKLQVSVLTQK